MFPIFRGTTKKGNVISGSLVITNSFIKHMPNTHTKTWIVVSAFGNGGWFNVLLREYVLPETVEQLVNKELDKWEKVKYE
jgi:hypothetical protein